MHDAILVKDLLARSTVGVDWWERRRPQNLLISFELEYDVRRCAITDNIAHTVDYSQASRSVLQLAEHKEFRCVEALCLELCRLCLRDFGIQRISVNVAQPNLSLYARVISTNMVRWGANAFQSPDPVSPGEISSEIVSYRSLP